MRTSMTVKEFTKDFFHRDNCPLRKRKQLRGFDWTRQTMVAHKNNLKNWILPQFGQKEIKTITYKDIDDYFVQLISTKVLSDNTINHILHTIQIIFQEAYRQKIINCNFTKNVEKNRVVQTQKGILTHDEMLKLFQNDMNWKNKEQKIINEIACFTGMRIGEIIALGYMSIFEAEGHTFLYVNKSWDVVEGIVPTKTKKNRLIPIPEWLVQEIKSISWISNFWFTNKHGKPVSRELVIKHFYHALNEIGITQEERKKRNITFHSWRHRFVSELTGEIPQEELQLIVGHSTERMTMHYTQQIADKTREIINSPFFQKE